MVNDKHFRKVKWMILESELGIDSKCLGLDVSALPLCCWETDGRISLSDDWVVDKATGLGGFMTLRVWKAVFVSSHPAVPFLWNSYHVASWWYVSFIWCHLSIDTICNKQYLSDVATVCMTNLTAANCGWEGTSRLLLLHHTWWNITVLQ